MNICGYSSCDLANGKGARVSIFISGCTLRCKGCFNKDSWDFDYGEKFTKEYKEKLFKDLSNPWIDGLSMLGGDPLEPQNLEEVTALCKEIKETFPNKTIWLWTGRKKEKIIDLPIMQYLDVVISEPFIEKYKDNLKYFGSSNQKIWWAKTGVDYNNEILYNNHAKKEVFVGEKTRGFDCACED